MLELWNILLCTTKVPKPAPLIQSWLLRGSLSLGRSFPCSQLVTAWLSPRLARSSSTGCGSLRAEEQGTPGCVWKVLDAGVRLKQCSCCIPAAASEPWTWAVLYFTSLPRCDPVAVLCLRAALGGQILQVLSGFIWFWIWPCSVLSTISAHSFLPWELESLGTLMILFFSHKAEETKW